MFLSLYILHSILNKTTFNLKWFDQSCQNFLSSTYQYTNSNLMLEKCTVYQLADDTNHNIFEWIRVKWRFDCMRMNRNNTRNLRNCLIQVTYWLYYWGPYNNHTVCKNFTIAIDKHPHLSTPPSSTSPTASGTTSSTAPASTCREKEGGNDKLFIKTIFFINKIFPNGLSIK